MKQTTHHSLLITLVALVGAIVTQPVSIEAAEKPNIVLIMTDDMGFNDISLYNGGAADGSDPLQGARLTLSGTAARTDDPAARSRRCSSRAKSWLASLL